MTARLTKREAQQTSRGQLGSGSPVSSHSRQTQSPVRSSRSLRAAGTIVTPQTGQIGGRSSSMRAVLPSYDPEVAPDWFVVNARDADWRAAEGRGSVGIFVDVDEDAQIGVNLFVLGKGETMAMYHWEADQEDYLVLAGEPLLIIEGEERAFGAGTSCTARPGRAM